MRLVQRQEPFPRWQFEDPASGDQLRLVNCRYRLESA
jgi:hypothetical protein